MRKIVSFGLLLLALTLQAQTARKITVNITPDGKANMVGYLPETPSGRAIVDCPGGGYSHLATQHEGHDWAEYFNRQGIAFFVLTYRMPNGDRSIPMGDAQQAIRTVRDSAQVWGINPEDVGIMGFSAGGHLASTVSTHSEYDCRPDFSILFYPVISMNERESHKGSCVNFLGKDGQKDEHPHGQRRRCGAACDQWRGLLFGYAPYGQRLYAACLSQWGPRFRLPFYLAFPRPDAE